MRADWINMTSTKSNKFGNVFVIITAINVKGIYINRNINKCARIDEIGSSSRGKDTFLIMSLLLRIEEVPERRLVEKNIHGKSPVKTKMG